MILKTGKLEGGGGCGEIGASVRPLRERWGGSSGGLNRGLSRDAATLLLGARPDGMKSWDSDRTLRGRVCSSTTYKSRTAEAT